MLLTPTIDNDIKRWLQEDTPYWDITSIADKKHKVVSAKILSKQKGTISGINICSRIFELCGVEVEAHQEDGTFVEEKDRILSLHGGTIQILQTERVALNILSHMSGISNYTAKLVDMVEREGLNTHVAATRKTIPGLRKYQKWAVRKGGGDTHRFDLSSMALIKENHIAAHGGIKPAIRNIRDEISFSQKIEIEVINTNQAVTAAKLGVDCILLDNFDISEIEKTIDAIQDIDSSILIEASGNIDEKTIVDYAKTGVDIVSLGKITHSVSNFDFTLLVEN